MFLIMLLVVLEISWIYKSTAEDVNGIHVTLEMAVKNSPAYLILLYSINELVTEKGIGISLCLW